MILKKGQKVWVVIPRQLAPPATLLATVIDPRGLRPMARYKNGRGHRIERRLIIPCRPGGLWIPAEYYTCAVAELSCYNHKKGGPA